MIVELHIMNDVAVLISVCSSGSQTHTQSTSKELHNLWISFEYEYVRRVFVIFIDIGVSAMGQVISLDLRSSLFRGIGILPPSSTTTSTIAFSITADNMSLENMVPSSTTDRMEDESVGGDEHVFEQNSSEMGPNEDDGELDYPLILNRLLPDDIQVFYWQYIILYVFIICFF